MCGHKTALEIFSNTLTDNAQLTIMYVKFPSEKNEKIVHITMGTNRKEASN